MSSRPNVIFVFGDQWRAQATGYAGNPDVQTPHIDALAAESVNMANAVSGCPVCTPYRASLLTGQYPLSHGLFINDVHLGNGAVSIAEAFAQSGYDTGYIGKWHVDGQGRTSWIAPDRRQGFEYWKVLECTHNYADSKYYAGDSPELLTWEGYDAIAQTRDAQQYISDHAGGEKPFLLMLSWGPPHNPFEGIPQRYVDLYDPADISLPPNVPDEHAEAARAEIALYYAHCSALDDCVGDLLETLAQAGIGDDTIFVFASDHGDMLHSQGARRKQRFWEESVRVPFLVRWPGLGARRVKEQIDAPDIMPTLLGLCELPVPETVEGRDLSPLLRGEDMEVDDAVVLSCICPFGEYTRDNGGREFRGIRTDRYAYVRSLDGPWRLYDLREDPYQLEDLCGRPEYADVQGELDAHLQDLLDARGDRFLSGDEYLAQWGYLVNQKRTTPTSAFQDRTDWSKFKPVHYWIEKERSEQ